MTVGEDGKKRERERAREREKEGEREICSFSFINKLVGMKLQRIKCRQRNKLSKYKNE